MRRLRLRALRASAWLWRAADGAHDRHRDHGSVGKTTAKECLARHPLGARSTLKTLHNRNDSTGVPRTILRLRPWHSLRGDRDRTAELGTMRRNARLARPDVAILLAVASTHTNVFRTLDDTAAEKAQILAAVPRRGVAILNADDERVRRMADGCRCRVESFGRSPDRDVWADEVSARWPARLALRVHAGDETQRIQTRLVGTHWRERDPGGGAGRARAGHRARRHRGCARAGGAVHRAHGARAPPERRDRDPGRDELVPRHVARRARGPARGCSARRRVLVASDLSDTGDRARLRYRKLGDHAFEAADAALFIGEHAAVAVKRAVARGMDPASVEGVLDVRTAAARIASLLRDGDLALLKGRATQHLSRALFAQLGGIGCWKSRCRRHIACDVCPELRPDFDLRAALSGVTDESRAGGRDTLGPAWSSARCDTGCSRRSCGWCAPTELAELRALAQSERLDPEKLRSLQQARAAEIVRFAVAHSAHYRERYARAGIEPRDLADPQAFEALPVLERAELRENHERIRSTEATPANVQRAVTGGTTGEPLRVLRDRRVDHRTLGWRLHRWWGVGPSENKAVIWRDATTDFWKTLRHEALWWPTRSVSMDANHIDERTTAKFLDGWERVRPALLTGYVGAVIELAQFVKQSGRAIPSPKAVATTSAPITPGQKQFLRDVFGHRPTTTTNASRVRCSPESARARMDCTSSPTPG